VAKFWQSRAGASGGVAVRGVAPKKGLFSGNRSKQLKEDAFLESRNRLKAVRSPKKSALQRVNVTLPSIVSIVLRLPSI
jgi:hypothetical protein